MLDDRSISEIECPNCQATIGLGDHKGDIQCGTCHRQFVLTGHLCPSCRTYHAESQGVCRECGSPLSQVCRHCHHHNWSGDDRCDTCGRSLTLFDVMVDSQTEGRDQRQTNKLAEIKKLRESSENASRERMAQMMADERSRQLRLSEREALRQRQDRWLLVGAFGAAALIVLIAGLIWLFLA